MSKKNLKLVTRADDAGSCRSANEAILEAVEAGIIKNVSFMAVGLEIEHAVELLGGRDDICCGMHVTLNAEWEEVKWGPICNVPALVDENGFFLPFPEDTKAQIEKEIEEAYQQEGNVWPAYPDVHDVATEVQQEITFQLGKLRELGLNISYLDDHMGVSWIGFRKQFAQFCRTEQLLDAVHLPSLPHPDTSDGDELGQLEKRVLGAMLDAYVWVTHPGKEAPDMQRMYLKGQAPGVIARERDAERRLLTDPELPALFERLRVKPARYDEVLNLRE